MERLLRTYQNNDEEYHELVRRYGECQRQLTLRIDLLQNSRNSNVSGTPSDRTGISLVSILMENSIADHELTASERLRIEENRKRAEELRLSQVIANDRSDVYVSSKRSKLTRTDLGFGGFIPEADDSESRKMSQNYEKDEELTDNENGEAGLQKPRRKKRQLPSDQPLPTGLIGTGQNDELVPLPPDQDTPMCDQCSRRFETSFLRKHFDVDVCDACREPKGIHTLITKSTAKDRYLLNDVDLDVREPKLRFILKRNPHNTSWGNMRLYLEAQVAERALTVWGSEEALEEERERRVKRVETSKLKQYNRKLKGSSSLLIPISVQLTCN
ncbi:DNA-repair protein complementing XP-A cell [Fasciola hepatica]|uniref:DNA-repair protein complementing XP-A cell n=1 Tax=Fasciola hepatica TaxID=6192 RepID=A0A4E0R1B8_FASHE|nr:DNA-repair protein complementing XP-A cell [Fasciola hepatica]